MLELCLISVLSQESITWLGPLLLPNASTYMNAHPIGGMLLAADSAVGEVDVVLLRSVFIFSIIIFI